MKRPWAVILALPRSWVVDRRSPPRIHFCKRPCRRRLLAVRVVLPGEQFSPGVVPQPAIAQFPR